MKNHLEDKTTFVLCTFWAAFSNVTTMHQARSTKEMRLYYKYYTLEQLGAINIFTVPCHEDNLQHTHKPDWILLKLKIYKSCHTFSFHTEVSFCNNRYQVAVTTNVQGLWQTDAEACLCKFK